tara:strand:- start:10 stop:594 length:585 start_codon:yes stop_codon:yes gene_type:complete
LIVSKKQKNQLDKFEDLLLFWNKTHNLISKSQATNIKEHIEDSLSITHLLGRNIMDLGSGGGFPGIPIAITCPKKKIFLVERKQSKAAFLLNTTIQLGLENIQVISKDSKKLSPDNFPSPIEIVTRAFGSPLKTIEATKELLKASKNHLKLMKTHPPEGLEDIPENYLVEKIEEIDLKGKDKGHILVTITNRRT